MKNHKAQMVTGAYGYSGKYIALKLLEMGNSVSTLTNSMARENPFGSRVRAFPYNFDRPEKLEKSLSGIDVLYNTYWVRFNHRNFTHEEAVKNSAILFECAKNAGVKRIVHISITNPSENSELEYFKGKALIEKSLVSTGISHCILRPAVLFGYEDILINNIAWALRKFPFFPVFGNGDYMIQPIHVDDLAGLAVEWGMNNENKIINAIGPETFTYRELVKTISRVINVHRPVISIPPSAGYILGKIISLFMKDILITREEIKGLMADLLHVSTPPTGKIRLSEWAAENSSTLGVNYASELGRRLDRIMGYGK